MGEWKEYRLGDLFERVTRKNTNLESKNVLTISAQHGLINQEEFFNKSVAGKNLTNYYLLKKGEFAYNKSYSAGYPMGATKMLEKYDDGIVSTLYICFRSKTELVYNEYFKYFFESNKYYEELAKIAQEGSRNHGLLNVSVKDFFNIKVMIPTLEEQKKIVEILQKVDLIIEKYDGLLKEKNQFIKSQFTKMFGDVFSDKNIFERKRLKDVSRIVSGTTPSTLQSSYWNGNINWITPAELKDSIIYYGETERKITQEGVKKSSLEIMPIGTVLFTTRAPIGKVGITIEKMACNQGFKNCICDKKVINNIYLYYLLKLNTSKFQKYGSGSTFQELSKSTFENIHVAIPPLELQNRFAKIVQLVDTQKQKIEEQRNNYMNLKKALMKLLLNRRVITKI